MEWAIPPVDSSYSSFFGAVVPEEGQGGGGEAFLCLRAGP